jgi:predicted ATPase
MRPLLVVFSGARGATSELHRLRGYLLRRLPSSDSTRHEGCSRTALAVTQQQCTRGYQLRDALGLARLPSAQGRRTEARDVLAPVYTRFNEGFDRSDLQEAKTLFKAVDA